MIIKLGTFRASAAATVQQAMLKGMDGCRILTAEDSIKPEDLAIYKLWADNNLRFKLVIYFPSGRVI